MDGKQCSLLSHQRSSDRPGLRSEWAGERGPSPIRLCHAARPYIPAKTCIRRKDDVVTALTNFSPTEFFDKERNKEGRREGREKGKGERKAKLLKSFQKGAA